MYSAKLYYDKRKRSNQGYSVKVMVYDSGSKKQDPISLRKYQTGTKLRVTHELTKTLDQYQECVSFCNQHRLNQEEAIEVKRKGHKDEQELEIEILEKRLKELRKEKQIDLFQFSDQFIEEKELQGRSTRHFK